MIQRVERGHENGALFHSDDWGDTWTRGSEDRNLRTRAWYYHHIYADPNDMNLRRAQRPRLVPWN